MNETMGEQLLPRDRPQRDANEVVPTTQTQRQFIQTLHELGAVLWEMDARTWRFTFVSERAERVFGYPIQRWYEEPTFWQDQLLHPEDREWCVSYCSLASQQCRDHAFLYRARTADGRVIWLKDIVRVIPDETGAAARMRGVMVDVTEELGAGVPPRGAELDFDAPDLDGLRAILAA